MVEGNKFMIQSPPAIGTLFRDRYRILALIGRGGMADVFKAFDEELRRPVAIKMLRQELLAGDDRARLARECRIIALLNHPYFVRLYEYDILAPDVPFMVMDYIDGCSLHSLLAASGQPMDCRDALKMCFILCNALTYAHEKGIVHRDLSPNNILFKGGNPLEPKIIDFGLSMLKRANRPATCITEPGSLMGTPHYLSPEQCIGSAVDGRADIYSLGCILYECITGRKVFDCDTAIGLVYKHLNEMPVTPSSLLPVLPGVDNVLSKALAKDKEERYQTTKALARDIQLILQGRNDEIEATSRIAVHKRQQRTKVLFSLAAAVLGCALLLGDPGLETVLLRLFNNVSPIARVPLITGLANMCGACGKPLAQIEAYQMFFASPPTVTASAVSVALDSFDRYAKRLLVSGDDAILIDRPKVISSLVVQYLNYLVETLSDPKRSSEIKDQVLATHLKNIQNMLPLSIKLPKLIDDDLTRISVVAKERHDMASERVGAELQLTRVEQSKDPRNQFIAYRSLGEYFAQLAPSPGYVRPQNLDLAYACYSRCLLLLDANPKLADIAKGELYESLLSDFWLVDYQSGRSYQALALGKRALAAGPVFKHDQQGFLFCLTGDYIQGIPLLEPSLAGGPGLPGDSRVSGESILAMAYICTGKYQLARYWLKGKADFRSDGLSSVLDLAEGNLVAGNKKLSQWFAKYNSSPAFTLCGAELARTLMAIGRNKECGDLCSTSLAYLERNGSPGSTASILLRFAQVKYSEGKFAQAEELCRRSMSLAFGNAGDVEFWSYERLLLMTRLMLLKENFHAAKCYARMALPMNPDASPKDMEVLLRAIGHNKSKV